MDADRQAVENILEGASEEARNVLTAVLKIEGDYEHMSRPPNARIERDIVAEVKRLVV